MQEHSEKISFAFLGSVAVEAMPLNAEIIGVYQDGDLIEFTFKPNRIEIHDDIITFLDTHRHGDSGFTAEVSFKRGTLLKIKVKS